VSGAADTRREAETLGTEFARTLGAEDFERLADLLHPEVDFRGLTPGRPWEAAGAGAVITEILAHWFEDSDEILSLEHLETDSFADRTRVGYRFLVRNPEGRFEVEQQAYLAAREERIDWMRVVCSGFRPVEG
jgi:hypothetical protein